MEEDNVMDIDLLWIASFTLNSDSASFKLINDVLTSLNNKLLVGGIFCDLQKASDCIDHDLLL